MYHYAQPHPAVTTDVVLFTIRAGRLELLLVRRRHEPFAGCWALPGGFLDIDEDLDTCAARELEEETGVRGVYLEQLYTFGAPERDPRERVIAVAYYGLAPADTIEVQAGSDAGAAAWFARDALPGLAFDHARIVELAHRRLAAKLSYSTIALQLLPREFTLSRVQAVYEVILGRPLDKRNFRRQLLALGCLQETDEHQRDGNHRPARLYRVRAPQTVAFFK
ncbi:MAG: NUDIX hydrolase [Gammaproteobacteria bacterium]|nr:NUDIX hydrolase [Gammaproteobacteria bacterium]